MFGSSCSCGNSIFTEKLENTECSQPCKGDSQQWCGGYLDAQSYYDNNLDIPGAPTKLLITNKTSTSIEIRWTDPENSKHLTQYLIGVNIVHTYAGHLLPSTQWTVQNDTRIELLNLHPATTYNVTVTAQNINKPGGAHSILVQTDIDTPDPEPEQPKIVSQTDTTRVIEIKQAVNYNGPITAYRVIVIIIDQDIVQNFDEKLLKNYKQSQEDGTNFYIAAEIEPVQGSRKFTVGDNSGTYGGYENPSLPASGHVHVSIGVVSKQDGITKVRYAATTHEQHDVLIVVDKPSSGKYYF